MQLFRRRLIYPNFVLNWFRHVLPHVNQDNFNPFMPIYELLNDLSCLFVFCRFPLSSNKRFSFYYQPKRLENMALESPMDQGARMLSDVNAQATKFISMFPTTRCCLFRPTFFDFSFSHSHEWRDVVVILSSSHDNSYISPHWSLGSIFCETPFQFPNSALSV